MAAASSLSLPLRTKYAASGLTNASMCACVVNEAQSQSVQCFDSPKGEVDSFIFCRSTYAIGQKSYVFRYFVLIILWHRSIPSHERLKRVCSRIAGP